MEPTQAQPIRYTYKYVEPSTAGPFVARIRYTRGRFSGWTKPMGFLNVRYAVFRNRASELLIPEYDLTAETKAAIPPAD